MCAFPNLSHSIEFATGYLHSKCSNIYKQCEYFWAPIVPDKGMNTYAMELFQFFVLNKFAC